MNEKLLLGAQIALIISFLLFVALHIAWFIYIWRFDFKWKYAQAAQRECGAKVMEQETVRWNMTKVFNDDRALRSLKKFTITVVVLYPIAYIFAAIVAGLAVRKTFKPVTASTLSPILEFLQHIPTPVYFNLIGVIFTIATMAVVAKYFGSNPRKNKLSDLMVPYAKSLLNVEKTMKLVKTRTQFAENTDRYDREEDLKNKVKKRVGIVQNAENKEMAEASMDSMSFKDWIGYLQFADDTSSTALCRYVQADISKLTTGEEVALFEESLNTLINTDLKPFAIKASDGKADEEFGRSVSISEDGNTIAITAPTKGAGEPSIYIYSRGDAEWKETILQPDFSSLQGTIGNVGRSATLSGDGNTLVVGASGIVLVFAKTTVNNVATWTQRQVITTTSSGFQTSFGCSVALSKDGSILAVGANEFNNNRGSIYIFKLSGLSYREVQSIVVGPGNMGDMFGTSITMSADGSTVAVGANNSTQAPTRQSGVQNASSSRLPLQSNEDLPGSTYVYVRSGATWELQQKLQPEGRNIKGFGTSVAISSDGKTLAVGAGGVDVSKPGFAFVYARNNTEWIQEARVQSSDHQIRDNFGASVALSPDGKVMVVGAYMDEHSSKAGAGSVYVFAKSGNDWFEQKRLYASDAGAQDLFGNSVALSSSVNARHANVLVVGAKRHNTTQGLDAGSAYVFDGYDTVWVEKDAITTCKLILMQSFPEATFPYLYQYASALNEGNIREFMSTWWVTPQKSRVREFRLTKGSDGTYRTTTNNELWENEITPLICQYWTANWGWNSSLKNPAFGDPSPQLKGVVLNTKLYFGCVFIFIMAILYAHVPKSTLLPLAIVALILVFMFAYVLQFMR